MIAPKWRHDGFVITSSSYSDIFYHFLYIFLPVWFVIYLWLYICDVILVSLCIYGIMMFLRFYGFKYRFFSFFWRYFFQKHIWKIQYIFLKVSNIMTSQFVFFTQRRLVFIVCLNILPIQVIYFTDDHQGTSWLIWCSSKVNR